MRTLAIIILTALLAASANADPPLGSYDGLPILEVNVDSGAREGSAASELRSLIDLERGYIFHTRDLTQVVKRLYAIGRFADIRVSIALVGRAVILHFELTPQRMLRELHTNGDSDKDVLADLRNALLPGEPVNEATIAQVKKRCERAWALVGYDSAVCEVASQVDGDTVDLTVSMKRGAPAWVTHIELTGNVRAPERELLHELQLAPGKIFTDKQYKADERAIRLAFYSRGFLTAAVRSEAKQDPARADGVIITYTIDAGSRVVLQVMGNRTFKDAELLAELRRQPDERLFPGTLDDWRRRVIARYHAHGFANVEAKVIPYLDRTRSVIHDVLTIKENHPVAVTAVSFEGAAFFSEERLRQELFATVDSKLDVPVITGSVDPDATKSLYEPHAGYNHPMPIGGPRVTSPVWRENTAIIYDPDSYALAIDNIRRLYLERGFTEVKIGTPTLTPSANPLYATVSIPLSEGPRSLVRSLSFSHTTAYDEEQVFALGTVKLGEPYSELQIEETKSLIIKALARKGYLYAQVDEEEGFSSDHTAADIAFKIREGDQVRIGRIIIQGGTRTSARVIEDRIALKVGEPFSPELAAKTKDNLLGSAAIGGVQSPIEAFDSVVVTLVEPDTPAERKDVLVRLVERKGNDLGFGAGISTGQGIRVSSDYTHHNLLGTASVLTLHAQLNRQVPFFIVPEFYGPYAAQIYQYYSNFKGFDQIERLLRGQIHTPRYLNLPGDPFFYVEATNQRSNTLSYTLESYTLLGGVDVAVNRNFSFGYENGISFNQLNCGTGFGNAQQSSRVQGCDVYSTNGYRARINQGSFLQGKFGTKLVLDFRPANERVSSRHGLVLELRSDYVVGEELAGKVAGISNPVEPYSFIRVEAKFRGYIPVGKRSSFMLALFAGNIFVINGGNVIAGLGNERFFLGGPNNLRGLVDQSLVPADACVDSSLASPTRCSNPNRRVSYTPAHAAIPATATTRAVAAKDYQPPVGPGGAFYALAQGEYRFPLVGDLFGALFVDAGNLYFDVRDYNPVKLKVDVGAGIRYATGVGNVAIDWGFNVTPSKIDGEQVPVFPYFYFSVF